MNMYSIATHNIKAISSYAKAEQYFTETKKPRTHRWLDHQRPLRDTRSTHLAIERRTSYGVKHYDLCLYQTPMVRFYEPAPDGSHAVHVQNHYSNSSRAFLWCHDWYNGKPLPLDTGERCHLMLSHESQLADVLWGDQFVSRIIVRPDGTVDTTRSVQIPFFRRKSSSTLRAKRALLKEKLSMVFDLLEYRYQEALDDVVVDTYNAGRSFGRRPMVTGAHDAKAVLRYGPLTPDGMNTIVQFAFNFLPAAADYLTSKNAYRLDADRTTWVRPVNDMPLRNQEPSVRDALTPSFESIKTMLTSEFLRMAKLEDGDEVEPYPQFATTVARNVHRSGLSSHMADSTTLINLFGIETYSKLTSRKGVIY
jgi:hypothetical protein